MSKIFYDHLVVFEEIDVELDKLSLEKEEREEIEDLIEDIIHHRVIDKILRCLPTQHHKEFLDKFHTRPYDARLIEYIDQKISDSIEKHIKEEVEKVKKEILADIRSVKKKH
jgi:hypothetical protein